MDLPKIKQIAIFKCMDRYVHGLVQSFPSLSNCKVMVEVADYQLTSNFSTHYNFIASNPFSGWVTGDFFICLNVAAWQPYFGVLDSMDFGELDIEEVLHSMFQEIINTSAAEAIGAIKEYFGTVTLMSPRLIVGRLIYPKATSVKISLYNPDKPSLKIDAVFSIDLMEQEISLENQRLQVDSITDNYGVFNQKFFQKQLTKMEVSYYEHGNYSVIFGDLNRLKYINDYFGHGAGDAYIQAACEVFKQSCRFSDFCCRAGGDELVILLPDCSWEESLRVVARIESGLTKAEFKWKRLSDGGEESIPLLMSLGTASNSEGISSKLVFKTADQRMEENKKLWYQQQNLIRRG